MNKKLLTTSALFSASMAMAFDTWIGWEGVSRVTTGLEDGTNTAGYWFVTKDDAEDGGKSKVVWPVEADGEGIDFLAPVIDHCGGVCGEADLVKGTMTYQPFVNVGFNVVGEGSDGPEPGDASSWEGICITYKSDVASSLELSLGKDMDATIGYALPAKSLTKTTVDYPKGRRIDLAWTDFKQPSWYKGATQVSGSDAALQLATINFKMQGSTGTYSFNICAIGPYNGACPETCRKALSLSDITVAAIADQEWTGAAICPDVVVKDGETPLVKGTDYTVECSDNVSSGEAKMTISGKGDYVGTISKTFKIVPQVILASGAVQVLKDQDGKRAFINGEYTDEGTVNIPENIANVSVEFNRTFTVNKYSTIVLPFEIAAGSVEGAVFYKIDDIGVNIVGNDTIWGPVHIAKVTDKIEANTPYLLEPTATRLTFKESVTLNTSEKHPYGFTKEGVRWEFRGTYHYFDFANDSTQLVGKSYGFVAKDQADGLKVGQFRWTSTKSYILPMRGYLVYKPVENGDENANGGDSQKNAPMPQYVLQSFSTPSVSSIPEALDVEIVDKDGSTTVIGKINTRTGEIRLNSRMADRWFDLQGRVLNGKPGVKGRYLHNGKIEIVK